MGQEMYDLIIVGSGPAGLCAAIYGKRAQLQMLVFEKDFVSGGQVLKTEEVDNYPGFLGIGGYELGEKFQEHAKKLGTEFCNEEIIEIKDEGNVKRVITEEREYLTRTVILAAGAGHKKLEVPGEEEFSGMGVSYCATCDGAFFSDKVTAVVGGGDVAVEDAVFLSRICKKVYLIHRRDELRAAKVLQKEVFAKENVEILWDTTVEEIKGEEQVQGILVKSVKTEETREILVDGVFVAIGIQPNTGLFKELVELDKSGYIAADETCETSMPGIFAAGDIRTKQLRQIVTAAADGANAVESVQRYLIESKK